MRETHRKRAPRFEFYNQKTALTKYMVEYGFLSTQITRCCY